jgi:adenylylsulfate kinase
MIYYFTGQPASGKTTLSKALISSNQLIDSKIIHIDGDDIRDIFQHKDYSEEGRKINIRRAHDIALFMDAKGFDVVISVVSPFRELRNELKSKTSVIEVYVHTTEDRGRNNYHVTAYEPPIEDFIDIDTTNKTITESLSQVMEYSYSHKNH